MVKLLKNLRWVLLPLTSILFILFVDSATDKYGISSGEEGLMYVTWVLIILNVSLFVFNRKWQALIDEWF